MTTSLTNEERAALALAAVKDLSDDALQQLVREGGHKAKLAKAKQGVREVYGTVLKLGEGVETLGALALLAQAYMEERKAAHDRKQHRVPEVLRHPITATELYPAGFSMDKAREEFKTLHSASVLTQGSVTETAVEDPVSPEASSTPSRRSRRP